MQQAFIIAGPNGAGKSTLAARFVPPGVEFLNADEIAKSIREPGQSVDIMAGRILLERLDERERLRAGFALETNLANRTLAVRIPRWQAQGYRVTLLYVWLPSADMAVARVAARVQSGGHDIPEATIRRRYEAGLRMFFHVYQPLVDAWKVFDNSERSGAVLVAQGRVWRRQTWTGIKDTLAEVKHEQ